MTAFHLRIYRLATMVAVTGFNPITFNSMRRRNGLFDGDGENGWAGYSFAQICSAFCAKRLIDHGLQTQRAVAYSNALVELFQDISERVAVWRTIAILRDGRIEQINLTSGDNATIGSLFPRNAGSLAIMVDLDSIVDHVRRTVAVLQ